MVYPWFHRHVLAEVFVVYSRFTYEVTAAVFLSFHPRIALV